jgi:hypothetical protein
VILRQAKQDLLDKALIYARCLEPGGDGDAIWHGARLRLAAKAYGQAVREEDERIRRIA